MLVHESENGQVIITPRTLMLAVMLSYLGLTMCKFEQAALALLRDAPLDVCSRPEMMCPPPAQVTLTSDCSPYGIPVILVAIASIKFGAASSPEQKQRVDVKSSA